MIVSYNRKFLKDLEKIKDKKIKVALKEKILELKKTKDFSSVEGIKKIKGHPNAFRIRIGKYMLGLFYSKEKIILQRFLKRNDIYKLFP
ncbi:MAG: type II toxin-antitoxin system RelE family toxin [Bacteroidota bacterium]